MQKTKTLYDQEFQPKIKSGELSERDALQLLRAKTDYLIYYENEARTKGNSAP